MLIKKVILTAGYCSSVLLLAVSVAHTRSRQYFWVIFLKRQHVVHRSRRAHRRKKTKKWLTECLKLSETKEVNSDIISLHLFDKYYFKKAPFKERLKKNYLFSDSIIFSSTRLSFSFKPCADRTLLICSRFSAVKTNRKGNSSSVPKSNDSLFTYCLNSWLIFSLLRHHGT